MAADDVTPVPPAQQAVAPLADIPAVLSAATPAALVAATTDVDEGAALQQVGARLLALWSDGPDELRTLAGSVTAGLAARGWDGDAELADLLRRAVAGEPMPKGAAPVDLALVADSMRTADGYPGCHVHRTSGDVLDAGLVDASREGMDHIRVAGPDWVFVEDGAREEYADLTSFVEWAGAHDAALGARLREAFEGAPGGVRRLQELLAGTPQWGAAWQVFDADRRQGRARALLAAVHVHALPRPAR